MIRANCTCSAEQRTASCRAASRSGKCPRLWLAIASSHAAWQSSPAIPASSASAAGSCPGRSRFKPTKFSRSLPGRSACVMRHAAMPPSRHSSSTPTSHKRGGLPSAIALHLRDHRLEFSSPGSRNKLHKLNIHNYIISQTIFNSLDNIFSVIFSKAVGWYDFYTYLVSFLLDNLTLDHILLIYKYPMKPNELSSIWPSHNIFNTTNDFLITGKDLPQAHGSSSQAAISPSR